jgi:hypothetical protein
MLLLLFLLGSAAPAVSRMDCLVSGHSEVTVGYADECCPEEGDAQGPIIKAVCCEVLTAEPGKQPFAPQPPVLVPDQPVLVQVLGVDVPAVVLHRPGVHIARRPPPPALAERLAEVGSFLI